MSDELDEFTPVKFEAMRAMSPVSLLELLTEDFEHFTSLSRQNQTQVYLRIKKLKPDPEVKDDHQFLLAQMKEEMAFNDNPVDNKQPGVTPPTKSTETEKEEEVDEKEVELLSVEAQQILEYIDLELTALRAKEKTNNWDGGRRSALKQLRNLIQPS